MRQADELARVKARIKALAEKTISNGCTEAEAMAAAEMVGRLLERYALTMEDVDIRAAQCVQLEVPLPGRQRRPVDGCVPAIARFCDCKVWLARDAASMRYVFFGFDTDVALAGYLFSVIERGIRHELMAFRETHPALRGVNLRRASVSYQQGMANRIAERLEALHMARESTVQAKRSADTSLILAKHHAVEEAFETIAVRLVAGRRSGIRLNRAYQQGYDAGDRVNLNRPLHTTRQGALG